MGAAFRFDGCSFFAEKLTGKREEMKNKDYKILENILMGLGPIKVYCLNNIFRFKKKS